MIMVTSAVFFSPYFFFVSLLFFSLSGMSYTAIVTYANNNFSSGTLQQGRSAFRPQLAYTRYNKEKRKRKKSSRLRMHLISRAMIFIWLTVTMQPCNYVTVLKNFRSFSLALPFFLPLSLFLLFEARSSFISLQKLYVQDLTIIAVIL